MLDMLILFSPFIILIAGIIFVIRLVVKQTSAVVETKDMYDDSAEERTKHLEVKQETLHELKEIKEAIVDTNNKYTELLVERKKHLEIQQAFLHELKEIREAIASRR